MSLSKLTLSVGLVNIPVEVENAIGAGTKPSGKYVCAESGHPMAGGGGGGGAMRCGHEHDNVCQRAIGYPKPDGSFFVPSDDELERLKATKDRLIKLDTFVPADEVDPVYFEKTMVIKPQKGVEPHFWLLAERLAKHNRIAVGSAVFDKDEKLLFLRWSKQFECLFLSVGCYDEQIKTSLIAGARATKTDVTFTRPMVQLADALIVNTFELPFIAETYQPDRWHGLRDLIVANGASPSGDIPAAQAPAPTGDLMTQLKATVAQKKKPAVKKPARSRRKVA